MALSKGVKKCFGLFSVLFITFLVFSGVYSEDANATTITQIKASQAFYTKNFESTETIESHGIQTLPAIVTSVSNPTGFWNYSQSFVFSNPISPKSGTGFQSSIRFTLRSTNGNLFNGNVQNLMAKSRLGFEGVSDNNPYCSQSWNLETWTLTSGTFVLQSSCPTGTFDNVTSFDNVTTTIDFKPESLFWCANDNFLHQCPSSVNIVLENVEYYFKPLNSSSDSYSQTIINQNQQIINQNQEIIDENHEAYNNISNQSASDIPNSSDSQTTSIIGVISGFLSALQSVQATDCELDLPFPEFLGGSTTVNVCNGKQMAPTIVTIGSSLLLICLFIPLAYVLLRMIYNEIRSWTNG